MVKIHKLGLLRYYSYKKQLKVFSKIFFEKKSYLLSKMFATGQSKNIQLISQKSAASHLVSAAAHLLAPEWSLA